MKRIASLLLAAVLLTAAGPRRPTQRLDCDFSKIKGVTSWFDSSHLPSLGVDSVGRVASYASKTINPATGTRISFTQATDANKGVRSRGDNRENLFPYSEDPSNAAWDKTTWPVSFAGNTMTATSGTNRHGTRQVFASGVAGQTYTCRADVTKGTHQYITVGDGSDAAWHNVVADLTAGTLSTPTNLVSSSIENTAADRYVVSATFTRTNAGSTACFVCFATASNNTSCTSFNAAGTETVTVNNLSLRHANADPVYVPTTTAPQYRGVNGRSVLRFDGVNDNYASTAVLSDIFAAGNKTAIAVTRINDASAIARILETAATNRWRMSVGDTANDLIIYNDDGGADTLTSAGAQVITNNVMRLKTWHDGTNIYSQINDGAIDSAASGNTSALTAALALGKGDAETLPGDLAELLTFNRALSSPELAHIDKCLKQKWGGK
jgi:hypothetical protein